jgi:hypothetical protein
MSNRKLSSPNISNPIKPRLDNEAIRDIVNIPPQTEANIKPAFRQINKQFKIIIADKLVIVKSKENSVSEIY